MKFETPEALSDALDDYFRSVTYEKYVLDDEGEKIINVDGLPVKELCFAVPPTCEKMCMHIGISDRTWRNYRVKEEYKDICEDAERLIRAWRKERISTRETDTNGLWRLLASESDLAERIEMELGKETRKALTMTERKNLLAKIKDMVAEDGTMEG